MPAWLRRLLARGAAREPLRGRPAVRRMKNYTAGSGYVYGYFYEGWRPASGGEEYLFTASGDGRNWTTVAVTVARGAVESWESAHGLRLLDSERYAVAKLALFDAFDERPTPREARAPVEVDAAAVGRYLDRLGIG